MKNVDRLYKARKIMQEVKQHEENKELKQCAIEIVLAISCMIEGQRDEDPKSKRK